MRFISETKSLLLSETKALLHEGSVEINVKPNLLAVSTCASGQD